MEGLPSDRVVVYVNDVWTPGQVGTGAVHRIFSNVRAYLDLGFQVEVMSFYAGTECSIDPPLSLRGARWTAILVTRPRSRQTRAVARFAKQLGWPRGAALDARFPLRPFVRATMRRQEAAAPGTLHHFEYLAPVTAIVGTSPMRAIWSMNDIESRYFAEMYDVRSSIGGPTLRPSDRAYLRDVSRAERAAARRSDLVLCIASHERDLVRQEWGCEQAEYLPMSLQDEDMPPRTRGWAEGGILRLLHVGSPAGLASFTSLRFIIEDVLPRIDPHLRERLELHVVGSFADHPRANRIRELARPYPQIRLHGFQPDVRRLYAGMDVQLVGSTQATGIRTRIIESFAYGVPVLSTRVGAMGLDGARDGENILLSEDSLDFVRNVERLLAEPSRLSALAHEGRNTYNSRYSRRVVAETLGELLRRHVAATSSRQVLRTTRA